MEYGQLGVGRNILDTLGLSEYYPSKISLEQVLTVENYPQKGENLSPKSLPWYILRELLMINYKGRDNVVTPPVEEATSGAQHTHRDMLSALDDALHVGDGNEEISGQLELNPLDVFVATFLCCDLFLRQTLVHKMFLCQLTVPFVLPRVLDGPLTYCLWALRSIIVENPGLSQNLPEISVVSHPIHTVSFVRLGCLHSSKSKILNSILSPKKHDTFFNYDCPNGNKPRFLANGLIEASWLVPSGKDPGSEFKSVVMFLNLRGDGITCHDQLQILDAVSNTVVICIDAAELKTYEHQKIATFEYVFQQCHEIVLLLLVKDSQSLQNDQLRKNMRAFIEKMNEFKHHHICLVFEFKGNAKKNASETILEVKKAVAKSLECQEGKCVSEPNISKVQLVVDEYKGPCMNGRLMADNVLQYLRDGSPNEWKKNMLPLQGDSWLEWTKLCKARQRSGGKNQPGSTLQERDIYQQKMNKLREKQFYSCVKPNSLNGRFIDSLRMLKDDHKSLRFFLLWLKFSLDLSSRKTLPALQRNYYEKWQKFKSSKDLPTSKQNEIRKTMDDAEKQLADASFGLEHLFREMGQMYEAVTSMKNKAHFPRYEIIEELPEIAATLLSLGHPIEIMDGDASHVPLTWVTAILENLEKYLGPKKLLVLSVLGIQSSGKSTLLNTMFGLQFAVSAGRCTRGVYLQLVKVDTSVFHYDYILVVDSEGLRAPELGQLKHDHDNELATLVIGLGDVTIINLKGENAEEIKDVLQVAVHAFLRMKLANKGINLNQTCILVHQNVSAANAKDKMKIGSQKLQEDLESMTTEAALIEACSEMIKNFNDIIEFNWEDHVWYFTDLWEGDPPMAPANPGYSKNVMQVKLSLLQELAKKHKNALTFSYLASRIKDLWNGILADDFVFSFRNTLAAKAYNDLERKYNDLTWTLENDMMKIQEQAKLKFENCGSIKLVEESFVEVGHKIETSGTEKLISAEQELEKYIEESSLGNILEQWKVEKLSSLGNVSSEFKSRTRKNVSQMKDSVVLDLSTQSEEERHKAEFLRMAQKHAENTTGSMQEIEEAFDQIWSQWEKQLPLNTDHSNINIEKIIEGVLYRQFATKDAKSIRDELGNNPLRNPPKMRTLENSIHENEIKNMLGSLKKLFSFTGWFHLKDIMDVINDTLHKVDTKLNEYMLCESQFQESYATEIVKITINEFEQQKEDASKLIGNLQVKVAVHICHFALMKFEQMQQKYIENHSIQAKLKANKQIMWKMFDNMVNKAKQELIVADFLCGKLEKIIKQTVTEKVPNEVYTELDGKYSTKFDLIAEILKELAIKNDFTGTMKYVRDAKTYALSLLTNKANEYFVTGPGENSRYATFAIAHVEQIVESLKKGVRGKLQTAFCEQTTDTSRQSDTTNIHGIVAWINMLREIMKDKISIPYTSMYEAQQHDVEDFTYFHQLLEKRISKMKARIIEHFTEITQDKAYWGNRTPFERVLTNKWGCEAACPFCLEPCYRTDANHTLNHKCIQHRPKGIRGTYWKSLMPLIFKESLQAGNCSYMASQGWWVQFSCGSCSCVCRESGYCNTSGSDQTYHNYSDLKKFVPDWDIPPSPTMDCSKYWKWFMATYKHDLKDHYSKKLPNVPYSWNDISKEEAIWSLRQ